MGQFVPSAGDNYKKFKDLTITEAEKLLRDSLIEINNKQNLPKIEITLQTLRKTEQNQPEQRKQRYTSDMTPVPDSYRLGPGDVISISPKVAQWI